jgi:integrase
VLWTGSKKPQIDPKPIQPAEFKVLLEIGGDPWAPWLYCGLNLCMHLNGVCELKWQEFDLNAGTYASIRGKTADKRIPRAATLWLETIELLRKIPKRGQSPYVFTSTHGTRYNRNTRGNDFTDLRNKAGLSHLTFSSLRDGAYTAAAQAPGVDEKWARLLAGHKSPGLQDHYVLRHPKIVKPACDAVYNHYFG